MKTCQFFGSTDTAVTVTDEYTEIATSGPIYMFGFRPGSITLENTGESALASVVLQIKTHPQGQWCDYLSDDDFANIYIVDMRYAWNSPEVAAGGTVTAIGFELVAAANVRFMAKCGTGESTTVRCYGMVMR
jgi:hypothetical protein